MTTAMMMMLLMTAAPGRGAWPMSANVPAEVRQAHADYLDGSWAAFSLHVREGLAARHHDPAATENLLELLDASFEARGGAALPTDWKLPEELTQLRVVVKRRESLRHGSVQYQLELFGEMKKGSVENVRIERYPNELVMDKQSGFGAWEITPGEDGGEELWASGECGPTPPPSGLYLITFKMKGKPEVKGWFALNHHASEASPYFLAPAPGVALGSTPTFRWDDFRSPQFKHWESRAAILLIFGPEWNISWMQFFDAPSAGEATTAPLKPGAYEAVLKFQERRRFGRLMVSRDSAIALPFRVEK